MRFGYQVGERYVSIDDRVRTKDRVVVRERVELVGQVE
jgi:hypothetical protein